MANKRRAHDEAWTNAKKICRLNARQVEMARALGMNPRKLPGLRPSPQERWKLPVGEFIEERYRKRFGDPRDHDPRGPEPRSGKPSTTDRDKDVSERVRNPAWQLSDLVCYLMNLADDLREESSATDALACHIGCRARAGAGSTAARGESPRNSSDAPFHDAFGVSSGMA